MAMDRPWPWSGPAQKARRLLYKLTTPILYKLTAPILYKLTAPILYKVTAPILYKLSAPILYKLTAPMTKHEYRADIMGVPRAAF